MNASRLASHAGGRFVRGQANPFATSLSTRRTETRDPLSPHSLLDDIIFKIVFGQHEEILRPLLNAILGLRGTDRIRAVTVLNPNVDSEYVGQRGAILDVRARDETGRQYNVEVQVRPQSHYVKRSLYYATRLYGQQVVRGTTFDHLMRTVAISILDFDLFPGVEKLHSVFRMKEREDNRELSDDLELHYIELRKFSPSKPEALRTPFEKWLYVLKFADVFELGIEPLPESLREEEGIAMALDEMKKAYSEDRVRELIEIRERAALDVATQLAEGRKEAAISIARNLLERGLDAKDVAEVTGLGVDEVAHLLRPGA